jgi:hypothetical protein
MSRANIILFLLHIRISECLVEVAVADWWSTDSLILKHCFNTKIYLRWYYELYSCPYRLVWQDIAQTELLLNFTYDIKIYQYELLTMPVEPECLCKAIASWNWLNSVAKTSYSTTPACIFNINQQLSTLLMRWIGFFSFFIPALDYMISFVGGHFPREDGVQVMVYLSSALAPCLCVMHMHNVVLLCKLVSILAFRQEHQQQFKLCFRMLTFSWSSIINLNVKVPNVLLRILLSAMCYFSISRSSTWE